MRNESVGVVDLRRNLSALLETTRQQPLMIHRYGTPWACVVSDEQWQQHRVQLGFDPGTHPLARLRRLQRQHLPLPEAGSLSPAAAARALILQGIFMIDDIGALYEQIHFDRLLHWFVGAGHALCEEEGIAVLRQAIDALLDDAAARSSLSLFLARPDVGSLATACGGAPLTGASLAGASLTGKSLSGA